MKRKLFIFGVFLIYIVSITSFIIDCNRKSQFIIESEIVISKSKNEKAYYVSTIPVVKENNAVEKKVKETKIVEVNNTIDGLEDNTKVLSDDGEVVSNLSEQDGSINENDGVLEDTKKFSIETIEILPEEEKKTLEVESIVENKVDNNEVTFDDKIVTLVENEVPKKEVLEQKNEELLKNGFETENGITYYYENNKKIKGIKNINGVNNYFSPSGKYLGTTKVKVIDVSYYQKNIDWDKFANESDCYGVILRLGYYETLDKKFERNINELKRLNIPYGIYLFSYASTLNGAKKEANFTNSMISKYDIDPVLGIYYDIESWNTKTSNSNGITKSMYDKIILHYINGVSSYTNYKYKVKVYSGRWYAMNRLGREAKKYVDWVAEYNSTCKYNGSYSMWQYTSKGSVPGITGNVDISYLY